MQGPELDTILTTMLDAAMGVTDLNFTPGCPPQVAVDGLLQAVRVDGLGERLTAAAIAALTESLVGSGTSIRDDQEATGVREFIRDVGGRARLRGSAFSTAAGSAISMRVLPIRVPTLDELGFGSGLDWMAGLRSGLVLVTGATGAGKTTTLAGILDRINSTRPVHVITLEDPVEYVHASRVATINQRERGREFNSFAGGLRAALRQAPRVILVGEMRDRDTMGVALRAAETGHLVFATLHTTHAGETVNRILAMFGVDEQELVRSRLAQTLRAVASQRLVPGTNGERVVLHEIMTATLRIRELIRRGEDTNRTFQDVIADSSVDGMQTFDQCITDRFRDGLISAAVAREFCSDRSLMGREIDRVLSEKGLETSDIGSLRLVNWRELRDRKRRPRDGSQTASCRATEAVDAAFEAPAVLESEPAEESHAPASGDGPADFLKRTSLFGGLSREAHDRILESCDIRRFQAGATLFCVGAACDTAYVVKSGVVEILRLERGAPEPRPVAYVGPGEVLTDLGVLSGGVHDSSARVPQEAEMLVIGKDALLELITDLPEIARQMCLHVAGRLGRVVRGARRGEEMPGLSGSLDYFDLSTIVQTLLGDRDRAGRLEVRDPSGSEWFRFALKNGRVIAAESARLQGVEAFHEAFLVDPSGFEFTFMIEPYGLERNATKDLASVPGITLLLEAIRRRDELAVLARQMPLQSDRLLRRGSAAPTLSDPDSLDAMAWVWERLAEGATAGTLTESAPFSRYRVLKALFDLETNGHLA